MKNTTTTPAPHPTDLAVLDEILSLLKEGATFCLSGHQNPDGDVIGSQLAMASLIRRLGKNKRVTIANSGSVPKSVSFLPGVSSIQNVSSVEGKYDVLIVFECSGSDRMGGIIDFGTQVGKVINIDHHLHNPNFGHVNFVEPTTSSTAELIFKIIDRSGLPVQPEEAICIFTGLVTDTGWFRYGNTNPQSHQIASRLLEVGVQVDELSEKIYLSRAPSAMRLLAWVLSHMTLHYDNRVAVLKIPEAVFKELGATSDDIEEVVNYGLQIESVRASIFLKERTNPPVIKVSLRSKGQTDINQIARLFGGGGHRNASGCSLPQGLEEAEKIILQEMPRIF